MNKRALVVSTLALALTATGLAVTYVRAASIGNPPHAGPPVRLTVAQAVAIAQRFQKGTVTDVQLENERGRQTYSIAIAGREIGIDADTGAVVPLRATEGADASDGDGETNDDQR